MADVKINNNTYDGVSIVQIPLSDDSGNAIFSEGIYVSGEITPEENITTLEIETGTNARYFHISATPLTNVINADSTRAISTIFVDFKDTNNNYTIGTNSGGTSVAAIGLPTDTAINNMATIDDSGKVVITVDAAKGGMGCFLAGVAYHWMAFGNF